jgi:hypothetical protein
LPNASGVRPEPVIERAPGLMVFGAGVGVDMRSRYHGIGEGDASL